MPRHVDKTESEPVLFHKYEARIADAGLPVPASSSSLELPFFVFNPTPGVTIRNSLPHPLQIPLASCTEPSALFPPAFFASRASFPPRVFGGPPIPASRIAL